MELYAVSEDIQADTTVAQVLADRFREVPFRAAFRNNPELDRWTVYAVTESAASLDAFLRACRSMPQFGDVQERRLVEIFEELARNLGRNGLPLRPRAINGGISAACPKANCEQAIDINAAWPLNGTFYPDFMTAWSGVYQRAWRMAHFDAFSYVPSSIPEFLKHPAVLRAEVSCEVDIDTYVSQSENLRESLLSVNRAKGTVLIDRARLDLVFGRHGPYARLDTDTLDEQRRMLRALPSLLPSSVTVGICNVEAVGLSSCSIVGDLITLAVAGGYLVTRDKALQTLLEGRCRSALQGAQSVEAYFAALA